MSQDLAVLGDQLAEVIVDKACVVQLPVTPLRDGPSNQGDSMPPGRLLTSRARFRA